MKNKVVVAMLCIALASCAGRDPQPIATVQPQDQTASCTQITAEIQANNIRVKELADEQGIKVAQNVAAGVAGLFIPVIWFGMDFKGAASKDVAALQARQQYLTTLATERCAPPPAVAGKRSPPPRAQSARVAAPRPLPPAPAAVQEAEDEPLAPYKEEVH